MTRSRFSALTADAHISRKKALLAMPQTWMNLSGRSVGEAVRFFQVDPEAVIVVHDEVDLPFGQIKIKRGGGHAGHNGLRSIVEVLGSSDFIRIRVGVGRPNGRIPMVDHVLSAFSRTEQEMLPGLIQEAADATEHVLAEGLAPAMNRYNIARI